MEYSFLRSEVVPSQAELDEIRSVVDTLGEPYISGSSGAKGYTYTPLPFKELSDLKCHRPDSWKRWEAIKSAVSIGHKVVSDMGCSTGFFSFKAAEAGATVAGFDYDLKAIEVARLCQNAYCPEYDLRFIHADIKTILEASDIILAMSVLHWIRISDGDAGLVDIVNNIATRCSLAIIELPIAGSGGAGIPWLTNQDMVGDWLREQGFPRVEKLVDVSSHAGPRRTWLCEGRKN